MPPVKSNANTRATSGTKSKDKLLLDLDAINKKIQQSEPRYNDKVEFEIIYYIIGTSFITFQFLHIYRLNFYNYDFKLYAYSLLILVRRLLQKFKQHKEITDPLQKDALTHILKFGMYGWTANIIYLTYQFLLQYSWSSIFFIIYFHLMTVLASVFLYKDQRYDNVINEINYLFKSTLFRSLEIIYFTLLLPLKCHDENLSYNLPNSIYIGCMALLNSTIYVIFFNVYYRCEEMRKQSKSLGAWKSIKLSNKESQNVEEWNITRTPYRKDSIVSFGKKFYKALSKFNAAVPGNLQFKLIYLIFHNHRRTRIYLIFIMGISIVGQNILLIYSNRGALYIMILLQSLFVLFFMLKLDRRLLRLLK